MKTKQVGRILALTTCLLMYGGALANASADVVLVTGNFGGTITILDFDWLYFVSFVSQGTTTALGGGTFQSSSYWEVNPTNNWGHMVMQLAGGSLTLEADFMGAVPWELEIWGGITCITSLKAQADMLEPLV